MSGGGEEVMRAGEIVWAMLILIIILSIVTFFFCCLPVYRALQARYTHWEDPENDPRWNVDQFQFSPTSPRLCKNENNRYNRLSTCSTGDSTGVSRGSSFRNHSGLPRVPDQVVIKMPPAYADIFNPGSGDLSSLGSPPEYYSHTPSDTEDSDKEKVEEVVISPNRNTQFGVNSSTLDTPVHTSGTEAQQIKTKQGLRPGSKPTPPATREPLGGQQEAKKAGTATILASKSSMTNKSAQKQDPDNADGPAVSKPNRKATVANSSKTGVAKSPSNTASAETTGKTSVGNKTTKLPASKTAAAVAEPKPSVRAAVVASKQAGTSASKSTASKPPATAATAAATASATVSKPATDAQVPPVKPRKTFKKIKKEDTEPK